MSNNPKVIIQSPGTGVLTSETIKRAMQKLAYLITHNVRAHHYTLNALGNNISRYIEAPRQETRSAAQKRVIWDFLCDECGATAAGFYPEHVQPNPTSCARQGCHGTMIPKKSDGGTHEHQ